MPGKKPNIFSKDTLRSTNLANIIDNAVNFDAKIKEREVVTRDTLRADCLIKALLGVSAEQFNSKGSINNKLINKILSRDKIYTELVIKQLLGLGGYKYSDINNFVYYLTWFACTDSEPEFKTLDEFAKSLEED